MADGTNELTKSEHGSAKMSAKTAAAGSPVSEPDESLKLLREGSLKPGAGAKAERLSQQELSEISSSRATGQGSNVFMREPPSGRVSLVSAHL